ncbi:hypothetical protein [Deferrisoma sp.]
MKPGWGPVGRVAASGGLGVVFALLYGAVAYLPVVGYGLPLRWAAAIQHWGRPLRFGLALAALACAWVALGIVHGVPPRIPDSRVRRRAAWVAWLAAAAVVAVLAAPTLLNPL